MFYHTIIFNVIVTLKCRCASPSGVLADYSYTFSNTNDTLKRKKRFNLKDNYSSTATSKPIKSILPDQFFRSFKFQITRIINKWHQFEFLPRFLRDISKLGFCR